MSPLDVRVRVNLRHFTLEADFVAREEITVIFGPSGSGKTTLLDAIAGMRRADQARIALGPELLEETARSISLPVHRRRIGYVLQALGLFDNMTVQANVAYGLQHLRKDERGERVDGILRDFGIAHLAARSAADISGGERQCVALARTLVTRPRALLLDEPLTALDLSTKLRLIADLKRWHAAHRIPVLYVTHSLDEVFALADRVLRLDTGRILADGPASDLLLTERAQLLAQLG